MTHSHVELRRGAYADSVTLLQVSRTVQGVDGVAAAQVAMATRSTSRCSPRWASRCPAEATPNDMVVAVRLDRRRRRSTRRWPASTRRWRESGRRRTRPERGGAAADHGRGAPRAPPTRSRWSRCPGASAFVEAMDAVEAGRDVMVFSDNVPVEQEVALKRAAAERGLLVMGPDCGTAVVGGLGLGFANVVPPGPVGIVAASGTGCQQVLALLDHAGVGVDHALGVGGRDLSAEVGGLATREALRRLDADAGVELIVLVSKPPAPEVGRRDRGVRRRLATPVELALLGAGQPDLTAATEAVLRRLGRDGAGLAGGRLGRGAVRRPAACAGCSSAARWRARRRLIATGPLGAERPGHTFVDFGDDALHAGPRAPDDRPDPAAGAPRPGGRRPGHRACCCSTSCSATAPSPTRPRCWRPRSPAYGKPVVVAVVGTAADPQGCDRQVRALADAGAEVHLSNAARHPARGRARPGGAVMSTPTAVVNVGADLLADAVAAQAVAGHPRRLAAADAGHRGRPRDGRRRPARARRPTRARSPRCSASPPTWSTSRRRPRLLGLRARAVPARRPADRAGSARPGRCAAR